MLSLHSKALLLLCLMLCSFAQMEICNIQIQHSSLLKGDDGTELPPKAGEGILRSWLEELALMHY